MHKLNNKGFAVAAIILVIVAVAAVLGTILFYRHLAVAPSSPFWGEGSAGNQSTTAQAPEPTSTAPIVASLDPQSGPVGTMVTIHGSGFGADNTIEMSNFVIGGMKDVASPDGKTLTFTVPSSLAPDCQPTQACPQFRILVTPNAYKISVTTSGVTQNIGTFTVTAK